MQLGLVTFSWRSVQYIHQSLKSQSPREVKGHLVTLFLSLPSLLQPLLKTFLLNPYSRVYVSSFCWVIQRSSSHQLVSLFDSARTNVFPLSPPLRARFWLPLEIPSQFHRSKLLSSWHILSYSWTLPSSWAVAHASIVVSSQATT